MFASLMTSRRFAPLFWCQFFSAFNDNVLKNALVFLILFQLGGPRSEMLVTLAGAVFIAPFFILSGLGGQLADRFDKAVVARRLKLAEIAASLAAVAGFAVHSVPVLFGALALFGAIAALFGPIKYGILPDHLTREELPAGNALVEAATFAAILGGTILAGIAMAAGGHPAVLAGIVVCFAFLCWGASLLIPPTGQAAPTLAVDRNVLRSTGTLVRELWADGRLWRGAVTVSWFWVVGAVVLSLLPALVKNGLGGGESVVTLLLAVFAVGVAAGSGLASWLAGGRIVLVPTPVAALLMGGFALDLAAATSGVAPGAALLSVPEFLRTGLGLRVAVDFGGLAVAGGLFIVPVFSAVQAWTAKDRRARVVAGVNVLSAAFMVAGALVLAGLQQAGLSTASLLAVLGVANLAAGILIVRTLPTNAFADLLWIFFRIVYRLEARGLGNIAKAGPNAIVALNHVSFLDAALALSLLPKEPVFAVDHGIAQRPWVKPFLKLTRAMPLDPTKPMATRALINAVKVGETLIIFPEGRLTVTGSLMKVYDGAGLIADKSGAKVVPVKIDGLERTPFSRLSGRQVRRRWWPKVVVTILEPVDLSVPPEIKGRGRRQAAGAALYAIMSDLVFRTFPLERTIFQAVVEAAEEHGFGRVAVEDPVAGSLTYRRLLVAATILARKLTAFAPEGAAVGVMLPSSTGAAVTLLALMSAGRVPAMINFTAGAAGIRAACRGAEVTTILTSRAFVEKAKLLPLVDALSAELSIVYLEDVRAAIRLADKLRGAFSFRRPLAAARRADDRAAILFTSGSEGTPKGVVLSHRNILANVAQVKARIDFGRTDKVFNVLPVFHSFGLSAGLILPLVEGVPVYLYPSPLHYRIVPELVYGSNATIFFGTDTFLAGYARSAHPYDFRSLRYIVAGAEPVKAATRQVYLEKFGIRILEGYGVTETAPVLALNTPMFNRFGTVGRIMPGMEARLDPVAGVDGGGRLRVRGPNVMLGYLRSENPGVLEPPPDGWHDTGDIVSIDAEGFVTIKGRAKRFAKIGGEMVSLAAVEAMAADLWPDHASVAVAVPDARKGERLVLVTEEKRADRAAFQSFAKSAGASDLSIPGEVVVAGTLPVLGSGKVDVAAVRDMVLARSTAETAAARPRTEATRNEKVPDEPALS